MTIKKAYIADCSCICCNVFESKKTGIVQILKIQAGIKRKFLAKGILEENCANILMCYSLLRTRIGGISR